MTIEGLSLVQVRGAARPVLAAGHPVLLGPERRPACWVPTGTPGADPFAQFRTVLQHFTAVSTN